MGCLTSAWGGLTGFLYCAHTKVSLWGAKGTAFAGKSNSSNRRGLARRDQLCSRADPSSRSSLAPGGQNGCIGRDLGKDLPVNGS